MESVKWAGAVLKSVSLITVISICVFMSGSPSAQFVDIGDETCVQNWAWYDYYTNGELTDSGYEPDGFTCFGSGGGVGGGAPGSGGGVGGGGPSPPDLADRDISAKLKCALDNYLHNDARLGLDRTMKKVNAWAFRKQHQNGGMQFEFRSSNISPGAGWIPVSGLASSGTAYGRLYNAAFQGSSSVAIDGVRSGSASKSLSGAISAFEMALLVGAHEASHLRGIQNEREADWHGIYAVEKYRNDGGAKCASASN